MHEWMVELSQSKSTSGGRKFSTRLIRKGALLEDTHRVFLEWDVAKSFEDNLSRARELNTPAADNVGWLNAVVATIPSRWRHESMLSTILQLTQPVSLDVCRPCILCLLRTVGDLS